jgi:phosphopentomutase
VPQANLSNTVVKPKADGDLWSTNCPSDLLETLSRKEIMRQEAIYEIIQSEAEFVKDLENTIKFYMMPLKELGVIPEERKETVVRDLFSNLSELLTVNSKLLKKLLQRQRENVIVDKIGDIFSNIAHEVYPYVAYGKQQVFSKIVLDEERSINQDFAKFIKANLNSFRKQGTSLNFENYRLRVF